MDFSLTDEQRASSTTTRAFVERELFPHEEEVERTGVLAPELAEQIRTKALAAGLYAANMPEERRRRRARHGDLGALREGARPGELRAALPASGGPRNILLAGTERRSASTTSTRR